MALEAKLFCAAERDHRAERNSIGRSATLRLAEEIPIDIVIINMSTTGALIWSDQPLEIGTTLSLGIPGLGKRWVRIVRGDGEEHGCEFETPLAPADIPTILRARTVVTAPFPKPLLPEPEIQKWSRRKRMALIIGAPTILWAGIIAGLWWAFKS